MNLTKSEIGKWVRIHFSDVGCVDGILLEIPEQNKPLSGKIFLLVDKTIRTFDNSTQVVAIGPLVVTEAPNF